MNKFLPNFLPIHEIGLKKTEYIFLILSVVVFTFLYSFYPLYAGLLLILVGFLFILSRPIWFLYLLPLFGLLIGLRFDFSQYWWARNIPYISALNASVVDFIAIGIVLALFVSYIFKLNPKKLSGFRISLSGLGIYSLFLLSAFISLYFLDLKSQFLVSLYYTLRNLLFVYFAFVFTFLALVKDSKEFHRLLWIFFWTGFGAAVFGFLSLFQDLGVWTRISPYSAFGFTPLKYNHNILAEALVAVVPIGGYLTTRVKEEYKNIMIIATGFIVLIALLTLSRAAWICLVMEAIVAVYLFRDKVKQIWNENRWVRNSALVLLLGALVYMATFLTSNVVESSTYARTTTLDIVEYYVVRRPWVGYGPGMFTDILEEVRVYEIEFGDPLDAHGYIQKILLEQGIIGLAAFGIFLLWVLKTIWTAKKHSSRQVLMGCLLLSVLAAITFQLFNTSYYNSHMWLPIGFALAGVKIFKRDLLTS